ncbi:MAG TPA: DUF2795 domain-containing protein [Actinoplanes sp.]|jgi:hypothetical protein
MDRGSSKHSARVDDEMADEVRGTVQGTAGGRAEDWHMAEPSGEDQPAVSVVPDTANDFSRFGSYLGRVFPADRETLLASAREFEAPDDVIDRLSALPPGRIYQNAAEVWEESS